MSFYSNSICALLGLLLLTACERAPLPERVHFAFLIPLSISPAADTVARGDTLWLTANFSDSLLDLRSHRRYHLPPKDIKIYTNVGFKHLVGAGQFYEGAAARFRVVNRVGQLRPVGGIFGRLDLVHDGQHYRARIGIIPQVVGVYALSFFPTFDSPIGPDNPLPFLHLPPDGNGDSRVAVLDDMYYVVNDGNTHFALQRLNNYVRSDKPGATEGTEYYETKGTYTFAVR